MRKKLFPSMSAPWLLEVNGSNDGALTVDEGTAMAALRTMNSRNPCRTSFYDF